MHAIANTSTTLYVRVLRDVRDGSSFTSYLDVIHWLMLLVFNRLNDIRNLFKQLYLTFRELFLSDLFYQSA